MGAGPIHDFIDHIAALVQVSTREQVLAGVSAIARVRAWLDAHEVRLAGLLDQVSATPEADLADRSCSSRRRAAQLARRSKTVAANPALGEALSDGAITAEHVDAFSRVLSNLDPTQHAALGEQTAGLLGEAKSLPFEAFERRLRDEKRRLEAETGDALLQRQRRSNRLNTWVDNESGMYRFSGSFDPENGLKIASRLDAAVAELFSEKPPEWCPTDPLEKQSFLRALAFAALIDGKVTGAGRPEIVVVVDTRQRDVDGGPVIDWGLPVEVPMSVLTELYERADVHAVVVRNGAVLHAPGVLNLGRSSRLASKAQRRALRALYSTCAIPGCSVPFDKTKIHHLREWEHGGLTNLDQLLPLCWSHHDMLHTKGWRVEFQPDRCVTVHLPDGRTLRGPPSRTAAAA